MEGHYLLHDVGTASLYIT